MVTGFRKMNVEEGFARRSATYLAALGYRSAEIRRTLIEELAMTESAADNVLASMDSNAPIGQAA